MLLPCWGRFMSTNAYVAIYNLLNHMCCLIQNLQHADIPFRNDSRTPLPKHHWDPQIIAVWNTQARLNSNYRNPMWLNHPAQSIPEAEWNTTRVSNDVHIRMLPLGAPPPVLNKLKRLKPDHLLVAKRHNHDTSLHPGQMTITQIQDKSSPSLALKVAGWKKIACTDGSIRHDHQQIIGAGVCIPDTNRIYHVNPNGSNITNTVHRTELAGIAAAATHDNFLIATDSENSMRQIRNRSGTLLHTYHIHHNLLETIIKAIRNTATLSIKILKLLAR